MLSFACTFLGVLALACGLNATSGRSSMSSMRNGNDSNLQPKSHSVFLTDRAEARHAVYTVGERNPHSESLSYRYNTVGQDSQKDVSTMTESEPQFSNGVITFTNRSTPHFLNQEDKYIPLQYRLRKRLKLLQRPLASRRGNSDKGLGFVNELYRQLIEKKLMDDDLRWRLCCCGMKRAGRSTQFVGLHWTCSGLRLHGTYTKCIGDHKLCSNWQSELSKNLKKLNSSEFFDNDNKIITPWFHIKPLTLHTGRVRKHRSKRALHLFNERKIFDHLFDANQLTATEETHEFQHDTNSNFRSTIKQVSSSSTGPEEILSQIKKHCEKILKLKNRLLLILKLDWLWKQDSNKPMDSYNESPALKAMVDILNKQNTLDIKQILHWRGNSKTGILLYLKRCLNKSVGSLNLRPLNSVRHKVEEDSALSKPDSSKTESHRPLLQQSRFSTKLEHNFTYPKFVLSNIVTNNVDDDTVSFLKSSKEHQTDPDLFINVTDASLLLPHDKRTQSSGNTNLYFTSTETCQHRVETRLVVLPGCIPKTIIIMMCQGTCHSRSVPQWDSEEQEINHVRHCTCCAPNSMKFKIIRFRCPRRRTRVLVKRLGYPFQCSCRPCSIVPEVEAEQPYDY